MRAVTNRKNDQYYVRNTGDLTEGSRSHSLTVCAAVAFDGFKSSMNFIVKVNSEAYVRILDEKVLPRAIENFDDRYNFTEDGYLVHTSNLTHE